MNFKVNFFFLLLFSTILFGNSTQEHCAFNAAQMRFAFFLAIGGDVEQEVAAFTKALEAYITQL
jgi:hypothetical protein